MKKLLHDFLFPQCTHELETAQRFLKQEATDKEFFKALAAKLELRMNEIEKRMVANALNARIKTAPPARNWPAHLRSLGVRDETIQDDYIPKPKER